MLEQVLKLWMSVDWGTCWPCVFTPVCSPPSHLCTVCSCCIRVIHFARILQLWTHKCHCLTFLPWILKINSRHFALTFFHSFSFSLSFSLALWQACRRATLHGLSTQRQKKSFWTWSLPCKEATRSGLSSELLEWDGGSVTSTLCGKWWRR